MAAPELVYGSESWTLTQNQRKRIEAVEIKFLRRVKECTLRDHIRNADIKQKLNIYLINDKIKQNKKKLDSTHKSVSYTHLDVYKRQV